MGRSEAIEAAWKELNEHLDIKVRIGVDTIHYGRSTTGEIFLTRDRLITMRENNVRCHWWEASQTVLEPPFVIPLESIERVYSTNDKKWKPYKTMSEKLNARGKALVAMVLKKKDKRGWCFFAPKTDADYKMQESMALAAAAMGSMSMGAGMYDQQVRTANRWAQIIREAVQSRKIAVLEEGGLVQAWKCAYCQTLNEAMSEKCSNCGSPRRN